tara:strand:- start:140 stop:286 length:147 start_codon:yes stop_codon:yes gene_type:complete
MKNIMSKVWNKIKEIISCTSCVCSAECKSWIKVIAAVAVGIIIGVCFL